MKESVNYPNNVLTRVIDRITAFFHFIAMLALGVMAALMIYDIVMRYFFHMPPDWVLDVVQLVQVTLAYTAAAPILRDGGHINMEMLQLMVSPRTLRRLEILSNAICSAGSFWMAALSWRTFIQSYNISESAYGIELQIWPWKFLVPLCFFILGLQFFGLFLKHWMNREPSPH